MSWSKFEDDCPGCKPALASVKTDENGQPIIKGGMAMVGDPLPDDDPQMVAILRVWNETTTRQEREAYHAVCCLGSQRPDHQRLAEGIFKRMQKALKEVKDG